MIIAIIIPTLNEEKNIKQAIEKTEHFLKKYLKRKNIDIVISDANSTDKTKEIVRKLTKKYSNLKLKILNLKGKGYQIAKTIAEEEYDFFICMDCDLATPLNFLVDMIYFFEKEYDVVIGSRFLKESKVKRTKKRKILGDGYRFLVKILFLLPVKDYQCGFKGFKRKKILPILNNIQDKKWIWDTEVIIRAYKANLKIKEFPISWEEKPNSKINIIKDPFIMGYSIIKLFFDIRIKG
jgi:hypothetical protein